MVMAEESSKMWVVYVESENVKYGILEKKKNEQCPKHLNSDLTQCAFFSHYFKN